ncbi:hypothetical protein CPB97_002405, partial [Podila verticillata]
NKFNKSKPPNGRGGDKATGMNPKDSKDSKDKTGGKPGGWKKPGEGKSWCKPGSSGSNTKSEEQGKAEEKSQ